MKLTFLSAQDLSNGQPFTSYVFIYTIDDSTLPHSLHITSSKLPQADEESSSGENRHDYAQRLFAGGLFVIESLWDKNKQLPDEQHTYDFPSEVNQAIPWEGYELVLK